MKVIVVSVAVWLICVGSLGYWYVEVGSRWAPVDAEYEQWRDYRLAFFGATLFPASLVVLLSVLWIEWRWLRRQRTSPSSERVRSANDEKRVSASRQTPKP